jgi:hypothetical protein
MACRRVLASFLCKDVFEARNDSCGGHMLLNFSENVSVSAFSVRERSVVYCSEKTVYGHIPTSKEPFIHQGIHV